MQFSLYMFVIRIIISYVCTWYRPDASAIAAAAVEISPVFRIALDNETLLVHGQMTIIFVVSVCLFVCLFVCLCRVFLSRV